MQPLHRTYMLYISLCIYRALTVNFNYQIFELEIDTVVRGLVLPFNVAVCSYMRIQVSTEQCQGIPRISPRKQGCQICRRRSATLFSKVIFPPIWQQCLVQFGQQRLKKGFSFSHIFFFFSFLKAIFLPWWRRG